MGYKVFSSLQSQAMSNNKLSMIDEIVSRERKQQFKSQLIEVSLELTADNYETFDETLNRRLLRKQVCQSNQLQGIRRCFQMYRDSHLFQLLDNMRDRKQQSMPYRISLACMDAEPEQRRELEWKWISTAFATSLWSVVLAFTAWFQPAVVETFDGLQAEHVLSAATMMLSISFIAILLFLYTRRDLTVFRSRQARVPLIIMETNKPDEVTFRMLRDDIVEGINKSNATRDVQDRLVAELKELRRLRDEAVIDEACYEEARRMIFQHPEYERQSSHP